MPTRHTLSIIVADQPGELSRIVGLFSARGLNIDAISMGQTLDPQWARVTIGASGDERTIEQLIKQCRRLTRVCEVQNITKSPHIEREMALIDVAATSDANVDDSPAGAVVTGQDSVVNIAPRP